MTFEAIDQSALLMAATPEPLPVPSDIVLLEVPKQPETGELVMASASDEIDIPADLAEPDPQIGEAPEGELDFVMDPLFNSGGYVDSNGNGQWDEGEALIATATRPKPVAGFSTSGDGGGGGGGMTSGSGGSGGQGSFINSDDAVCVKGAAVESTETIADC